MRFVDLSGQVFNNLTVLNRHQSNNKRRVFWVCRCICGKETVVESDHIKRGHTVSCGCLKGDLISKRFTTHGNTKLKNPTLEYTTWLHIKVRCTDPTLKYYKDYGGRGIRVCDEWENDFAQFLLDMGKRPFKNAQIDRIDNNKGYCKENCRWVTSKVNNNNRRDNIKIELNGETLSIQEIAEKVGMKYASFRSRLSRGWSIEKAMTQPQRKRTALTFK